MVPCRCALALAFSPTAGCIAPPLYMLFRSVSRLAVANDIAKPQVSRKSNNSSTDSKKLLPEMEICNRKEKVTSTRVLAVLLAARTTLRVLNSGRLKRRGRWGRPSPQLAHNCLNKRNFPYKRHTITIITISIGPICKAP